MIGVICTITFSYSACHNLHMKEISESVIRIEVTCSITFAHCLPCVAHKRDFCFSGHPFGAAVISRPPDYLAYQEAFRLVRHPAWLYSEQPIALDTDLSVMHVLCISRARNIFFIQVAQLYLQMLNKDVVCRISF